MNSVGEIEAAWEYAGRSGRFDRGRVIVEERIAFDYEITQLTVRAPDRAGSIVTSFCEPIGHIQVHGDYVESWQPQPMSALALRRAREIAGAVAEELGGCGIFGVELFVAGDDVWFSEVSSRPHDTGLATLCSQRKSEFALHANAILGLPVDVRLREPGASAVIYGGIQGIAVMFDGVAEALSVPCSEVRLFGKPESFPKRRMGGALATGRDVQEARERAEPCAGMIKPGLPKRAGHV